MIILKWDATHRILNELRLYDFDQSIEYKVFLKYTLGCTLTHLNNGLIQFEFEDPKDEIMFKIRFGHYL